MILYIFYLSILLLFKNFRLNCYIVSWFIFNDAVKVIIRFSITTKVSLIHSTDSIQCDLRFTSDIVGFTQALNYLLLSFQFVFFFFVIKVK